MLRSKSAWWKLALAVLLCVLGLWAVGDHFRVRHRVDGDARQLKAIVAELSQADPAYRDLTVVVSTHPKAWIFGTVDSQARLDAVRARAERNFGVDEARRMVGMIRIREAGATRPSGADAGRG